MRLNGRGEPYWVAAKPRYPTNYNRTEAGLPGLAGCDGVGRLPERRWAGWTMRIEVPAYLQMNVRPVDKM